MKWRLIVSYSVCLLGFAGLAASLLIPQDLEVRLDRVASSPQAVALMHQLVQRVDKEFEESWNEAGLESADSAPTLAIMRRASLALHGTIPSLQEIRTFAGSTDPAQLSDPLVLSDKTDLIDRYVRYLLSDRRYADYVSERLARVYVGVEEGPFILYRRRRFQLWLSDQLNQNRPYDELCRELISGNGVWTSDPQVNFITVTITDDNGGRPDIAKLAGRTSRAFLGMRLDCLQCHNDNLGTMDLSPDGVGREGLQTDFHQFAAFFSQASVSLGGIQDDQEHYSYTYLGDESETLVPPMYPFNHNLTVPQGTRRQQLAEWITHRENRAFSRAAVNRVWAIIFGKPLTDSVDDIPLTGPFPPGLELLATDFADNGYNLKRLIQVMMRLQVFRNDSRAAFTVTGQHENAWSVFPLVRLRPDQVAGGIAQSATVRTINADVSYTVRQQQQADIDAFVKRYGDTGEDEFEDRGGTITQRLLMMNGRYVKERTRTSTDSNGSARIAEITEDNKDAIELTYLCVLTRLPSETELHYFLLSFKDVNESERRRKLEDLFWTLVNSTEFSWNH